MTEVNQSYTAQITDEMIGDIWDAALMPIGSWARISRMTTSPYPYASGYLIHGGVYQFTEALSMSTTKGLGILSKEKMASGIAMAASYLSMSVSEFYEQHDALMADMAVQFGLFGELVYG